jgi:hypothetical protein
MMLRLMTAALLTASLTVLASADQKDATTQSSTPQMSATTNSQPPYLVSESEHVMVLFEADENALKSVLPPGVKPAAGNVVGLNMYRAKQVVGLVPYNSTYLWINVDGFDSPDGTKGRWMAQGWYGPEPVPTVFKSQAGFPVQLGETSYERDGNRIHTVLRVDGVNLVEAAIELKQGSPTAASGVLNYPVSSRNLATLGNHAASDIVVNRIPFTGEVSPASPGTVQFHFRTSDAAKVLQPKRLLDALYFKGTAFVLGVVDLKPHEITTGAIAPARQ